jgi:hypothetical protein
VLGNDDTGLFGWGNNDYERIVELKIGKAPTGDNPGNTLTSLEYFFEGATVIQAIWSVPSTADGGVDSVECRDNPDSCEVGQRQGF